MNYQERFKSLILRMKKDLQRYDKVNLIPETDDEKRIHCICEKFHGENTSDPSGFNIKDDINPCYVNKLLDELEEILNKLNW